jgi:hypothetical protein
MRDKQIEVQRAIGSAWVVGWGARPGPWDSRPLKLVAIELGIGATTGGHPPVVQHLDKPAIPARRFQNATAGCAKGDQTFVDELLHALRQPVDPVLADHPLANRSAIDLPTRGEDAATGLVALQAIEKIQHLRGSRRPSGSHTEDRSPALQIGPPEPTARR